MSTAIIKNADNGMFLVEWNDNSINYYYTINEAFAAIKKELLDE